MVALIESVVTLAVGGAYGGSIGNLLAYWEQAGFFSYVLPFLLIFALVFGILTKVKIFPDNKALNAVIALSVGLLSLQFNFVPVFFSEIFPRVGVGLAVILAMFILLGLFLPKQSTSALNWLLFGVGLLIFVLVISKTFGYLGYGSGSGIWYLLRDNFGAILTAVIVLGVLGAIITAGNPPLKAPQMPQQYWQGGSGP